jgi:tetrapyrrole methylase family protein/MazG family protein
MKVVRFDPEHRRDVLEFPLPHFCSDSVSRKRFQDIGLDFEIVSETDLEGTLFLLPPSEFDLALTTVDDLLGPNGCPWDRAQTHESLRPYVIEEAYEVVDAINNGEPSAMVDELGDLLLQPLLHGQIASKAGTFSARDIAAHLRAKLIRRHPHVFGAQSAETPEEVLVLWENQKESERKSESVLDHIPRSLPALARAQKISKRAAKAGFEWPNIEAVIEKVAEEAKELAAARTPKEQEAELGDLLFTIVNVARWLDIDSEVALASMLARFERRFRWMESHTSTPLSDLSLEQWDDLWNSAKVATDS